MDYKTNNPKVWAIPIKDNRESLIDISKKYRNLFYDRTRKNVYKLAKSGCKLRTGVAKRLGLAQKYLPKGIVLKIKEGYRPIAVQKIIFDEHLKYLRKKYPGKSQKYLKNKAVEYVAPPDNTPPHSTGGAVDLTLMTKNGKELDMGQTINNSGKESLTDYKHISSRARKNRKILIKAMRQAGFVNYPFEWWHWSYGDRYWAFMKGKKYAIYGSV